MSLLQRIDPRRSLAAAIGWLMIALAICLALAANLWLRSFVRSTLLEVHSQRLETAGEHVSAELDTAMLLRLVRGCDRSVQAGRHAPRQPRAQARDTA
jgi:hypothetical protein